MEPAGLGSCLPHDQELPQPFQALSPSHVVWGYPISSGVAGSPARCQLHSRSPSFCMSSRRLLTLKKETEPINKNEQYPGSGGVRL